MATKGTLQALKVAKQRKPAGHTAKMTAHHTKSREVETDQTGVDEAGKLESRI
jgi:hypothetical protein